MKHQNLLVLLITIFSVITISCSNDEEDEDLMGKWYRVSDFDGLARGEATSFTIGNKGYLTGGYDGRKHLNDLWEYDMELDFWTQKASFPGTPRSSATAFSIDTKGYFGTGYDGKTISRIFGSIIRKQMYGVRKLIIREAPAMMLQHSDCQTRIPGQRI